MLREDILDSDGERETKTDRPSRHITGQGGSVLASE